MSAKEQLGKDAWTKAALSALAEEGLRGVAVEPLARALKVTKGSFYWHFENRDALLRDVLLRWETTQTDALIQAAQAIADPRERLTRLVEWAHRSPRGLSLARVLAAEAAHPIIGPVLRRVSERRLAFLAECFESLDLRRDHAKHAARVVYAAYLGLAELNALGLGLHTKAEQRSYLEQLLAGLLSRAARS